jgi:hypothetical protein
MRLAKFLQYSGLDGNTTEEKARIFAENGIKDVNWAFSNILKFDGQVDRCFIAWFIPALKDISSSMLICNAAISSVSGSISLYSCSCFEYVSQLFFQSVLFLL